MRSIIITLLPLAAACAPTYLTPGEAGADQEARMAVDSEEAALAIHAANQLDFDTLDSGLDRRAAENIVAARPFATLDDLDAVAWVGAVALDDLAELGRDAFGTVPFGEQVIPIDTLTLYAANELDHATLDSFLDRRAADGIVAARPFASVDDLDAVPYVGGAALDRLLEAGTDTFGATCTAGTLTRADGFVATDLATAFGGEGAHVLACAGTFYGEAAWFEGADHDVALYGFGAGETVFDGYDENAFVVGLADTSTYTLYGATLENSHEGWFSAVGSSRAYTMIELLGVHMHRNAADKGGAVYTLSDIVAIDSVFTDNTATWYGGAVAGRSGVFVDCTFEQNVATDQASAVRMWHQLTMLGGSVQRHLGPAAVAVYTSDEAGTSLEIDGVDFGTSDDANAVDVERYGDVYEHIDLGDDAWIVCNGSVCAQDL